MQQRLQFPVLAAHWEVGPLLSYISSGMGVPQVNTLLLHTVPINGALALYATIDWSSEPRVCWTMGDLRCV